MRFFVPGALLGTTVMNVLSLNQPSSKHRLRSWAGLSATQFEWRYWQAPAVGSEIKNLNRILLLKDVCTEGSTLRTAAQRIKEANPSCEARKVGQIIARGDRR